MDMVSPSATNGNIPLKRCPRCEQWLPATLDYFHRQSCKACGLSSHCKTCHNATQREAYKRPDVKEKIALAQKARYQQSDFRERQLTQQKAHRSLPEVKQQRKAYDKEYMRRSQVKENRQTYYREYLSQPGKRERARARTRQYQGSPQGRQRRKAYIHLPEVRQQMRLREKAYRESPKGRLNSQVKSAIRHARKKTLKGSYTSEQIQAQLQRQRYRCYYADCGFSKFPRKKQHGIWMYSGYEIEHTYPISRIAGSDIPANDIGYIVLVCPTCNRRKQDKFPWEWPEGGRLL